MHATIRRYEGVDTTRTNEVVSKVQETLVPQLRRLPGFAGYYLIEADNGVLSSLGLFQTSEQGDESTLIERRSGSGWIQVPSPSPAERANRLMGIAAPATDQVWAVGYGLRVATGSLTLIEVFDGTRWRVVRSPNK